MIKMRNKAYRRHHRERVINKRLKFANTIVGWKEYFEENPNKIGRLDKWHFSCGCWMCKLIRKSGPIIKCDEI